MAWLHAAKHADGFFRLFKHLELHFSSVSAGYETKRNEKIQAWTASFTSVGVRPDKNY